jgi:hypothetical protein
LQFSNTDPPALGFLHVSSARRAPMSLSNNISGDFAQRWEKHNASMYMGRIDLACPQSQILLSILWACVQKSGGTYTPHTFERAARLNYHVYRRPPARPRRSRTIVALIKSGRLLGFSSELDHVWTEVLTSTKVCNFFSCLSDKSLSPFSCVCGQESAVEKLPKIHEHRERYIIQYMNASVARPFEMFSTDETETFVDMAVPFST